LELAPEPGKDVLSSAAEAADKVAAAAQRFLAVLHAEPEGEAAAQDVSLNAIPVCLALLASLQTMKPVSKDAQAFQSRLLSLLDSVAGIRLLLAWLLMRETGIDANAFGLDYTLRRMLAPADGLPAAFDAQRAVLLFRAMLTCRVTGVPGKNKKVSLQDETVFSQPTCCDFMQVHTSGGVEWFNKERFEELSEWLAVTAIARLAEQRPAGRTVVAWLATAERDLKQRAELAVHAGYRTALFLRLLETSAKGELGGSAKTHKKPGGKKGTDVQGSTRTRPAKTPNDKLPR